MALVTHRHRELEGWAGSSGPGPHQGSAPIHCLFPVQSHKCIPPSAAFQRGVRAPFSVRCCFYQKRAGCCSLPWALQGAGGAQHPTYLWETNLCHAFAPSFSVFLLKNYKAPSYSED